MTTETTPRIVIDGIPDGGTRILEAYYSGLMPDPIKAFMADKVGPTKSAVPMMIDLAEIVYAHLDKDTELTPALKELAAACAVYCAEWGFHGMDQNNKGTRMASILRGQELPESVEAPMSILPPIPEVNPVMGPATTGPEDTEE